MTTSRRASWSSSIKVVEVPAVLRFALLYGADPCQAGTENSRGPGGMLQRSYYYGLSPKEVPRQKTKVAKVGRPGRGQGKGGRHAAARMCLPRLMGDRLMGNRLGSRLWALGGTWHGTHARSSGTPCLPACLPTPGSSSPSSCLSVDRGAKQLSTVKHMTTSCSFLPAIIRLTLSLPSTARAEQGRGELDEDPDQELDQEGTSHRTTSQRKHNKRPDSCFLAPSLAKPRVLLVPFPSPSRVAPARH